MSGWRFSVRPRNRIESSLSSSRISLRDWLRVLAIADAGGFRPSEFAERPLISESALRGHDPITTRWTTESWFPGFTLSQEDANKLKEQLADFRQSGDSLAVYLRNAVFIGDRVYREDFFMWLHSPICSEAIDAVLHLPIGPIQATVEGKEIRLEVLR